MLLPMFGLFSALLFFGGVLSLPVMADRHAADKAPYTFALFFAGLIAWILVPITFGLAEALDRKGLAVGDLVGSVLVFAAPLAGLTCGALLGYRLGVNYKHRRARFEK